ncbi:hypothetical protein SeMB42_g04597 [Synchytrium endobioticum]|uniref:Small monomeric GTPase n=1 Tax=Synchytrium endobioticum TaxID=286115 RepID=A0A507CWZ8_9FUNG|nr:hypothetical protein SeMB42_g04597 [Synchytrium endobioticum]TPX45795.1 hypothetical protein SeLEV6574_g03652 [Synchytrium endobioticum]
MVVEDGTKVVVVGAAGCGKTALVTRLLAGTFSAEYMQTFGAELFVKTFLESKQRTLQIWCCAGHERYRALMEQFYKDARAALVCFDMCSAASFNEARFWLGEVKRAAPDVHVVLVGTKVDEGDQVVIKTCQAHELGVADFVSVSSKTGAGVAEVFDLVLRRL